MITCHCCCHQSTHQLSLSLSWSMHYWCTPNHSKLQQAVSSLSHVPLRCQQEDQVSNMSAIILARHKTSPDNAWSMVNLDLHVEHLDWSCNGSESKPDDRRSEKTTKYKNRRLGTMKLFRVVNKEVDFINVDVPHVHTKNRHIKLFKHNCDIFCHQLAI